MDFILDECSCSDDAWSGDEENDEPILEKRVGPRKKSKSNPSGFTLEEEYILGESRFRLKPNTFDPSKKTLTVPFSTFSKCLNTICGMVRLKLFQNGSLKSLVTKIEKDLMIRLRDPSDFYGVKAELEERGFHLTIFLSTSEDKDCFHVECTNCNEERQLIREVKKQNSKKAFTVSKDIMILVNGSSGAVHLLRVDRVEILCRRCHKVYSTSGHDCSGIHRQIPMLKHQKVFRKQLCVDIFYDIETYKKTSKTLQTGLVAFTYNVRISNPTNPPLDQVQNELFALVQTATCEIHQMLVDGNVPHIMLYPGKFSYYIIDEDLMEEDDVMFSFADMVERICRFFVYSLTFPVNTKVTLISFNGNKFDDFFLFKSLVTKRKMCNTPLHKFSILERGSKLLCISFRCEPPDEVKFDMVEKEDGTVSKKRKKRERGKNKKFVPWVDFRTQDLRNFISIGSLDANAKLYGIDCMKTVFPHKLMDFLARNPDHPRVLDSFPEYEYYDDVIKIDFCPHGKRNGCAPCRWDYYNQLKLEFGEGPFDTFLIWRTYCCNDVHVTEKLYYKFFSTLKELYEPLFAPKTIDPTFALTLPSLTNTFAYLYATAKFGKEIMYTPLSDHLEHCYEAIYGGHCQTSVIGQIPNPEKLIFFDFNGEYAGLMECPLPCGKITEIGPDYGEFLNDQVNLVWSHDNKSAHFKDLPPFIVKCRLIAPIDPRLIFDLPNVPQRSTTDGCLKWTFESKSGTYSSVDVFVAVHYYRYTFELTPCETNLKFEKYEYVLRDYIKFCQRLKQDGKREKNKCKENVGKLMGNALYGYQIKKQDKDKNQFVNSNAEFIELRTLEYANQIKINKVLEVKDIINFNKNPNFLIKNRQVPHYYMNIPGVRVRVNEAPPTEDVGMLPKPTSFPCLVKFSFTSTYKANSDTMPQFGIFVLSFSRVLNSQLYFEVLIKEEELSLPIEERPQVVYYTDTDSFLVEESRMDGAKWVGNPNVTYNQLTEKFEPWGKNELDFQPKEILVAGRKLYCCVGPDNQLKTAAKGVDRNQVTVDRFRKIINDEIVTFDQETFKKNFDTYDIEMANIQRNLSLTTMYLKPFKVFRPNSDDLPCIYYRPFTDYDSKESKEQACFVTPNFKQIVMDMNL